MRGNIFDIKRYAIHDGPGIRTTVFLKGCHLRCRWCHNPESQSLEPCAMWQVQKLGGREFREERTVGYAISPEELWKEIQKDQVFFEESGGGVTFSGGEPLAQPQFLLECLRLCKSHNLHTCVDTAGVASSALLEEICRNTDLFLYDIKTAEAEKFADYIGGGFSTVWDNLRLVVASGSRVIIRIPVIPDFNQSAEAMDKILAALQTFPGIREVNLLPYHRTGADKYKRLGMEYGMGGAKNLTDADLAGFKQKFEQKGYQVK